MRCRTCDYTLFDIRQRTCPECGSPFKPSDFDFHQSAVKFCCPHCNQDYYGMDARGHLVPRAFNCVTCGQAIDMDEMVIQPTVGVAEDQTQQAALPWTDPRRRWAFRRFFATVGWSMGRPTELGRSLRVRPRVGRAFIFACIISLASGAWMLPFFLVGAAGRSAGSLLRDILPVFAGFIGVATIGAIALIIVWGLLAHAILRVGGGKARSIATTFECIAYSAGPALLMAVPCLGAYTLPIVLVWSAVCLTLTLRAAHECSRTRAGLAAWSLPLIAMTSVAALIIGFLVPQFMSASNAINSAPITPPPPSTTPMQPGNAPLDSGVTDPAPEVTPAEPPMDQPPNPPAPRAPEPQERPHVPDTPQP